MDVVPTSLTVAGLDRDELNSDSTKLSPQGVSWTNLMNAESVEPQVIAWQSLGTRAVQIGPWKASYLIPPVGDGSWKLFDLSVDPFEAVDLADDHPDRLAEMTERWEQIMDERGLIESPPMFMTMIMPPKRADQAE